MITHQKGFSVVEILVVIAAVGLLGAVGWLVYDRNKSKTSDTSNTQANTQQEEASKKGTETAADPYADWETASFELVQASFKYPKSLKMTHEVKADASPNTGFETYTLTADDNTMISLVAFHFHGGFTGDEPAYLIEDVITGTEKTNNREFSSIIYKNSNGVYDTAYVTDSTQTKYKAGQESQITTTSFSLKPKGANTAPSRLSISISGQKYQTYQTLAEIKSMGAYKDIDTFLNALNIPANE